MIYVGNAFSLQMVQDGQLTRTDGATAEGVMFDICNNDIENCRFCIGHADTARMAAQSLNDAAEAAGDFDYVPLSEEHLFQRRNISLVPGDVLYVMQVMGGRLPEGCTELPEGIQLVWRKVTVL